MKIGLDVRWLRRSRIDGIGRVVLALTPPIVSRGGHEFVLLYHEERTRDLLEPEVADTAAEWVRLDYPLLSLRDALELPRDLRALGIEAYYTFNYLTSPFHRGYRVAGMVQDLIPFVHPATVRSSRSVWRLFFASTAPARLILRRFDVIHVPSAATARDVARLFPAFAEKVRVAPYGPLPGRGIGTEDAARELHALGLRPGYILYVGRFEPYKNVGSLVAAHRALDASLRAEHPLVLVGRASDDIARAGERDPTIVVTGPLEDLESIYQGAALFAYPSLYEGFGLPPLEAMARGVPVITTNRASLPEVVGDAAILTDGTSDALSSALSELLRDTRRRAELADAGRRRAARFDWKTTAARVLEEFDR